MGGIYHPVEAFFPEEGFHLPFIQPFGGDYDPWDLFQQLSSVLRGGAGGNGKAFKRGQPLHQLPPLGGPGKNAKLIHPGILWESPDSPR